MIEFEIYHIDNRIIYVISVNSKEKEILNNQKIIFNINNKKKWREK